MLQDSSLRAPEGGGLSWCIDAALDAAVLAGPSSPRLGTYLRRAPMCRPCVCLRSCQRVSTAQWARVIDPGPCRRPPGRRFVLHRTSGPRLRCAAFRTLLSAPSNAACCCSCAPPRCFPGPCRSHHPHPSPGRPAASISTRLTRPCALRAGPRPVARRLISLVSVAHTMITSSGDGLSSLSIK